MGDRAYTRDDPIWKHNDNRKSRYRVCHSNASAVSIASRTAELNRMLASLRAKVEHPSRIIKRQFAYTKVRYRGLLKNA